MRSPPPVPRMAALAHVRVRGSDMRPHIIVGLLRLSENMLLGSMGSQNVGGEDEES